MTKMYEIYHSQRGALMAIIRLHMKENTVVFPSYDKSLDMKMHNINMTRGAIKEYETSMIKLDQIWRYKQ